MHKEFFIVAPRPGLEQGTYGFTFRADFLVPDDFVWKNYQSMSNVKLTSLVAIDEVSVSYSYVVS